MPIRTNATAIRPSLDAGVPVSGSFGNTVAVVVHVVGTVSSVPGCGQPAGTGVSSTSGHGGQVMVVGTAVVSSTVGGAVGGTVVGGTVVGVVVVVGTVVGGTVVGVVVVVGSVSLQTVSTKFFGMTEFGVPAVTPSTSLRWMIFSRPPGDVNVPSDPAVVASTTPSGISVVNSGVTLTPPMLMVHCSFNCAGVDALPGYVSSETYGEAVTEPDGTSMPVSITFCGAKSSME